MSDKLDIEEYKRSSTPGRYNFILLGYERLQQPKRVAALKALNYQFRRIIMDEAQNAKSKNRSKALKDIKATFHWYVSGTVCSNISNFQQPLFPVVLQSYGMSFEI